MSSSSTAQGKNHFTIPFWQDFCKKIEEYGQIEKFIKLVEAIATGKLSPTNLAWKCALDMGVLSMCTSTTNMRYDKDCVEFFSLFNLMFGASAINVLRGTAHFSSIVEDTSEKGKYDPCTGNYNFPIPLVNTLKKVSTGCPTDISVSFIEQSLEMAQEQAKCGEQFVIGFGGKMVAQGCKWDCDGDVNLWGHKKPMIGSCVRNLNLHKQCVCDIDFPSKEHNISKHRSTLTRLTLHVSHALKQLYGHMSYSFYQCQKLVRLATDNPDNVMRYNTQMSFLHQNSSECEGVFRHGLDVQDDILRCLALLSGWNETDEKITLSTMPNCFQLLEPSDICGFINLKDENNYHFVKQRSEEWFTIRQTTCVTGSTLYKAIGLDTLQHQKDHHYTYVCRRCLSAPDSDLAKRLQHGTENEVNIISTLAAKIMPAFLPPCYTYFEVRPKIIKHDMNAFKIEVSADGLLKCTYCEACKSYSEHGDRTIVLEFKSPYLTKQNPHVTAYDVQQHYVLQLLCECKAWDCAEGWLLVGTSESVTGFWFYSDESTLGKLLDTAEDLYGRAKPPVPMKLHPATTDNREKIKNYLSTHTSFFIQCSTIPGEHGHIVKGSEFKSPYDITPNFDLTEISHTDVDFQVAVVTSGAERLFTCAHTVPAQQSNRSSCLYAHQQRSNSN